MNYLLFLFTILIGLSLMSWLIGSGLYRNSFRKQVRRFFEESSANGSRLFSEEDLAGLPCPVQAYFRTVLKAGQVPISSARLLHSGKFKTGIKKDWVPIRGEQYFTTNPPGFIWLGKTSIFSARDLYVNGKGKLVVHLFSLFRVVNAEGPSVDQGELLRWLAEGVWFPTNLLPRPGLRWEALDDHSAKLHYTYEGLSVSYTVYFNAKGEIIRMETQRYRDEKNKDLWIGELLDYESRGSVRVPTRIQASWELEEGIFTYADFMLEKLEYDRPLPF